MSAKPKTPKKRHPQIEELKLIIRSMNFEFVEELRFHPVRMWRFDLAIPSQKLAIEYQGLGALGARKGKDGKVHVGGHASVGGMSNDCEKLNAATALGWKVLKFTALHFDQRKREVNKLSAPYHAIKDAIMGIQHPQPTLF
jgi:hypothetical protein